MAETPGLVGIMSLDPNTVDKLGDWDILSSFELCSNLVKDGKFVILCEEESVDTELEESTGKSDDGCTLVFDTFLANDLNAAAKDDACGV